MKIKGFTDNEENLNFDKQLCYITNFVRFDLYELNETWNLFKTERTLSALMKT